MDTDNFYLINMNMKLEEFVKSFADLFEDTDPSEIVAETDFRELDEWDSLMVLSVIAFVKTNCKKDVTGKEIRSCSNVEELYNLVENK